MIERKNTGQATKEIFSWNEALILARKRCKICIISKFVLMWFYMYLLFIQYCDQIKEALSL